MQNTTKISFFTQILEKRDSFSRSCIDVYKRQPYTIVGGVPAKPIRKRFSEETIAGLQDLFWWDWEEEKIARHIWDIQAGNVEKLKKA